jgi:hypothetical protein
MNGESKRRKSLVPPEKRTCGALNTYGAIRQAGARCRAGTPWSRRYRPPRRRRSPLRAVAPTAHGGELVHEKTGGNHFFVIRFLQEPRKSTEN